MSDRTLYSVGGAATRLGVSRQLLRNLEAEGLIPIPHRLIGSDRRAYDSAQMEAVRAVVAERRAARPGRFKRPEVRAA